MYHGPPQSLVELPGHLRTLASYARRTPRDEFPPGLFKPTYGPRVYKYAQARDKLDKIADGLGKGGHNLNNSQGMRIIRWIAKTAMRILQSPATGEKILKEDLNYLATQFDNSSNVNIVELGRPEPSKECLRLVKTLKMCGTKPWQFD